MKNLRLIFTALIMIAVIFTSCKKEDDIQEKNIVPSKFSVDIPSSLSNVATKSLKGAVSDTLQGGEIYNHLRTFVKVGESAAEIVEAIMKAIGRYNLSKPMTFSYTSDDDNRVKNIVIVEKSTFEGKTWEYQLDITDADSEGAADGGTAMQVFWNNSPVEGIAIIKPYNMDRTPEDDFAGETGMFRIDYSETGANNYEQQMTVYISDLPDKTDKYAMKSLKMFVGKSGDMIDVYGNSSHPNAYFFTEDEKGFNWAFAGAAYDSKNISTAEVGLPAGNLDSDSRTVILEDNSVHAIFSRLISIAYPGASQEDIDNYLKNTEAPGFFADGGFVAAGTQPSSDYTPLVNSMNNLTPYNPSKILTLSVKFKGETSSLGVK